MKDGQTIGQWLNWDFEANGGLKIKDKNGKRIYWEDSSECWVKREYDSQGNEIYHENSDGFWAKREYNSKGNNIYLEDSKGYWIKREYDSKGNEIYFENSSGIIIDKRPKPCSDKEIIIEGVKYKLTKV